MDRSSALADPFADADQTTQCLSEVRDQQEEGPVCVVATIDAINVSARESLEGPPIYETVLDPVADHIIPVASEVEWYETLRELQENIAGLRIARGRASRFAALSHAAPAFWRARKHRRSEESVREVRVLEELVLAGMRRLSRLHPDPLVQAEWNSRSEEFSRFLRSSSEGSDVLTGISGHDLEGGRAARGKRRASRLFIKDENDSALAGLSKAIGILLLTPVALAGVAVFGAGAMMYGAGQFVVELGHLMTCGKLR